MAIFEHWYFTR